MYGFQTGGMLPTGMLSCCNSVFDSADNDFVVIQSACSNSTRYERDPEQLKPIRFVQDTERLFSLSLLSYNLVIWYNNSDPRPNCCWTEDKPKT